MERQSKENIKLFMNTLDEKSRKIIWFFQWHGHLKLEKLVGHLNAASDMEVLQLIKEVINPTADRILGEPILEFRESEMDSHSGKKIFYNWWFLGFGDSEQEVADNIENNLVDIFEEEDKIVVVSQISPSIRVSDNAKIKQRHGILSIEINKLK